MATKRLIISGPGFPGTNDTLRTLNDGILENAEALAKLCGDKCIITGVNQVGANHTAGWVVYNGEILPFEAGATQATVSIYEEVQTAEYDADLNEDSVNDILPISKTRIMKFGSGGVVTFNFSQLVRLKTILQLSQFELPAGMVIDPLYVHTDENFTADLLAKLNGIAAGAQVNVKPNWNAPAGNVAEILNKPTNLLTYLRKGYSNLGNFPNGTDEIRTISFPDVGTANYFVLGTLVSLGTNWSDDNDQMWIIKNKTATSFQIAAREVTSQTQNVRFDYVLIPF